MRHGIYTLIAVMAMGIFSACTRAEEENLSVHISLPQSASKVGAQSSNSELNHVIINITGVGLSQPITGQWESCSDCFPAKIMPSEFSFKEIPSGQKTIQVLAVYKNSGQAMQINYGSITQEPSTGINVNVKPIPTLDGDANSLGGNISGRYIKQDGTGPTGQVAVIYKHSASTPPMVIEKSMIAAGWFQVVGLDNVNFDYQIEETGSLTSLSLFGSEKNMGSFVPADNLLKAAVPAHKKVESNRPDSNDPAEYYVWGYFGPGSSGRYIKNLENSSNAFGKFKVYGTSTALTANGSYGNSTTVFPTKAELTNTASPYGSAKFYGGQANPGGTELVNYLKVDRTMLENGNDNSAGFRVPFAFVGPNGPFTISTGVGTKTISGKVLPGVPDAVDSYRAYKKTDALNLNIERTSCDVISKDGAWQTSGIDYPVANPAGTFSVIVDMTAAEASQGSAVVLCGIKNGKMYERGAFLGSYWFNMGGGIALPAPAKIGIVAAGARVQALREACMPIIIDLVDATNAPAAGANVNVALAANQGNFYSSDSCDSMQIISSINLNYQSKAIVYFMNTTPTNATLTATPPAGIVGKLSASSTENLALASVSPSAAVNLAIVDPQMNFNTLATVDRYECRELYLQLQSSSYEPAKIPPSTSFAVPSSDLGLETFSDPNCISSTTEVNFSSSPQPNQTQVRFFARAVNSPTVTPSGGPYSSQFNLISNPISVTDHTGATNLSLTVGGLIYDGGVMKLPTGVCLPVMARTQVMANGKFVNAPPSSTIDATYSAVATNATVNFYTSSSCSMTSSAVTFTNANYEMKRFMKITGVSGNADVQIAIADTTSGGPFLSSFVFPMQQPAPIVKLSATTKVVDGWENNPSAPGRNWAWNTNCLMLKTELSYGGNPYSMPSDMSSSFLFTTTAGANYYSSYASGCNGPIGTAFSTDGPSAGKSFFRTYYQRGSGSPMFTTFGNNLSAADFNKSADVSFSFGLELSVTGATSYSSAGTNYVVTANHMGGSGIALYPSNPGLSPFSLTLTGSVPGVSIGGGNSVDLSTSNSANVILSGGSMSSAGITIGTVPTYDSEIQKTPLSGINGS